MKNIIPSFKDSLFSKNTDILDILIDVNKSKNKHFIIQEYLKL